MTNGDLVSLYHLNSLRIDAYASALDRIKNETQLLESLELAYRNSEAILALGAGTNIVLASDFYGRVLHQSIRGIQLLGSSLENIYIRAYAGENWHKFVMWTVENKCYGLENLALIPGNVGAAPVQNIGAFGVEIESFISKINAVQIDDGLSVSIENKDCAFGYRTSIFKKEMFDKLVIVSVDFVLSRVPRPVIIYPSLIDYVNTKDSPKTPEGVLEAIIEIRSSRLPDPLKIPNVGSFFKNPIVCSSQAVELKRRYPDFPFKSHDRESVQLSAGWMVEKCGWKGHQVDGVGISADHALILVNSGGATGNAVLKLAKQIKLSVMEQFGLELEIEPRVIST